MSTITLVPIVLFASLCIRHLPSVDANYYYHSGGNDNTYHHLRNRGQYAAGVSQHYPALRHNHHHGSNGRLQQAAVGVVSRGRLLPLTTTTVSTPTTTLSPLDRLMSRLDSLEKQSNNHYDDGKRIHESYHQGRHHGQIPTSLLKSSDRRFAQMRSKMEDSFEDEDDDDDDDDEDVDVLDDGVRDEEDEDEENDEDEYYKFGGMRHQQRHRVQSDQKSSGHSGIDDAWYDGLVADFPDNQPSGSGSDSGSDGGSGRRTGYSSYSDYKWKTFNRNNMDHLRNLRGKPTAAKSSEPADIRKAVEHTLTMSKEGNCKIPKPRVIQVKDVYPHPSKAYIPRCTILHQCTDDTGCCRDESLTCTARRTEPVDLYFYTITIIEGPNGARTKSAPTAEKLTFQNHTDCVCVDKQQELMPRDRPFPSSEFDNLGKSDFRGYYRPDSESTKTVNNNSCRCTSQFSPRHTDGSCLCECFDKQRDCLRLKRGKDFLTHEDRMCILRGDCMSPSCEFGSYLRKQGRCPRKHEKFEAWQQYPLHDEEYN